MKCCEIMTLNPKVCVPDDEVAVAINLMWDHDCGVVPVVKNHESKELVGIVTDRDIVMSVVKHINAHPSQVKVNDCMALLVIACQLDDPIEKAIELMSNHQILSYSNRRRKWQLHGCYFADRLAGTST